MAVVGVPEGMVECMGWDSRPTRSSAVRGTKGIRPDPGRVPAGTGRPFAGRGFAPFHGAHVCQSRAGFWRDHHDFNPDDGRCLYCNEAESAQHKEHPEGGYCSYCREQWPCDGSSL